jgi:hypothetical protein
MHMHQNKIYFLRRKIAWSIFVAALALVFTGCQWVGLGNHVTPQISGRVLSAETRAPLAGVAVNHFNRAQPDSVGNPPHGAQLLRQEKPVLSDAAGRFVFPSKNYVTLLRSATWWSLKLTFQAAGYATVQTNFTAAQVTGHADDGTPLIDAGDILLEPLPR